MKKLLFFILLISTFVLNIFLNTSQVLATSLPLKVDGSVGDDSSLILGQKHSYSVVFRGNEEAVVYAKLIVSNPEENSIKNYSIEIPGVSPSELVIYQQNLPKVCSKYDPDDYKKCTEYRNPTYDNYYSYYGSGDATYSKLKYNKTGDKYNFDLKNEIKPNETAALIVSYVARGYVEKKLGVYNFKYETIKVPSRITDLNVSVDVDSDLILKGKKSEVKYNSSNKESAGASLQSADFSSSSVDKLVGQIGNTGSLIKNAKNLSPNESFLVKGEYAKNWYQLYLGSIIISIFILGAIITGVYFLGRIIKKNKKNKNDELSQLGGSSIVESSVNTISVKNTLVSLFSAVSIIFITAVIQFLSKNIDNIFYGSSEIFPIIAVLFMVGVAIVYILAIFGPAIYISTKEGWKSFVFILLLEFMWIAIFLLLFFTLFSSGIFSSESPIYPDYNRSIVD